MDKIKQTDRHTHKHAHIHLYTYTNTRKHAHIVSPISSLYYIIPYSIHTRKHTPIPTHTHTHHSHRQTCASIIRKAICTHHTTTESENRHLSMHIVGAVYVVPVWSTSINHV